MRQRILSFLLVFCCFAAEGISGSGAEKAARLQERAESVLEDDPDHYAGLFNRGVAQYWRGDFESAAESFHRAADVAEDRASRGNAKYNAGNALFKQQQYEEALEAYRSGLLANPSDRQLQYNYTVLKKLLDQQQPQDQQGESQSDPDASEQQEEQQQEAQPDEGDPQEQQREESKPQEISRQDAERLLRALEEQEKRNMDKRRVIIDGPEQEKNW